MLISAFWKKVTALMSGSLAAQGINVLMLPVLARLYLPETFGLFGVFIAALAVLVVVVNMGYEMAIMLPEDQNEARGLLRLSLWACLVISLLTAVLVGLMPEAWLARIGMEGLDHWIWWLPVSVALEGLIQPFGVGLNRRQQYRALTWLRVARAAVTAILSLIGGLLGWELAGLMVGHLAGQAVMALAGGWIWMLGNEAFTFSGSLKTLAYRYRDFPGYGMASAWLNVASKQVIFFLMPGYFGEAPTGQYAKAERVLNLPPGLLSMTVGRVFYEEASGANREGHASLAAITRHTFYRLALIGLPVLTALAAWGPDLFAWVLGEPWRQAGDFARWLSPWLYLTMIASPLSYLIDIRRKLQEFLLFNAALFLVRVGVLIYAASRWDATTTVAWFGTAGAIMVALQILYLLNIGGFFSANQEP